MLTIIFLSLIAMFLLAGFFISIEAKRRKARTIAMKQSAGAKSGVGRAVSDQN